MQQVENAVDQATIDELVSVTEGDKTFLADLLLTYQEQALTILAAMNDAIARGDRVAAGRSAHALRGASLNEVFLSLTGHPAEELEEESEEAGKGSR